MGVTVVKMAWCCLLAGVVAAGLMFPVAGGIGLLSNRATDVVANGSAQLLSGDVPQVTTIVDTAGNPIAWLYSQRRFEVTSDQIANTMKLAIVSIEDKRFAEFVATPELGALLPALYPGLFEDPATGATYPKGGVYGDHRARFAAAAAPHHHHRRDRHLRREAVFPARGDSG